jgi:hypothetical protein
MSAGAGQDWGHRGRSRDGGLGKWPGPGGDISCSGLNVQNPVKPTVVLSGESMG